MNLLTSKYQKTTKRCLCCNKDEDPSHSMTCKQQEQWHHKLIHKLQQTLNNTMMEIRLQQQILSGVKKQSDSDLKKSDKQRQNGEHSHVA